MKNIEIIGGGTVSHVRNHLALCAPAYGTTAKFIHSACVMNDEAYHQYGINLHLTKMADNNSSPISKTELETNEDVSKLVDELIANLDTKIIFFNPALVDYEGSITISGPVGYEWSDDITTKSGKYEERLQTSKGEQSMLLWPSKKILGKIRQERKDIFLVAFKTTCGATQDEQFLTALHLLKTNSCNLVLANDTKTRMNMIVTPEQARYYVTEDRRTVLKGLVEMTLARSKGTFTRTEAPPSDERGLPWNNETIPDSLRKVVNHCIVQGAYKPFNGATVGHFAVKMPMNDWIATSKRKTNFNDLDKVGLVLCQPLYGNRMLAVGGKPSVGGMSQRIIFKDHPGLDCIVHFHCPPKPGATLSVREQKMFECGSHECGQNTSDGLKPVGNGIECVYLDNHGPNIVFHRSTDPQKVIDFIDQNFDLSQSTDGVDRSQVGAS